MKDYYNVLGISRDASQEEIKKAYRYQANIYHPDVSSNPDSLEKMKLINEAYSTLKDPSKKLEYDQYGSTSSSNSQNTSDFREQFRNYNPNVNQYEYNSGFIFQKEAYRFVRVIVKLVIIFFVIDALINLFSFLNFGFVRNEARAYDYNLASGENNKVAINSYSPGFLKKGSVKEVTIPSTYSGYDIVEIGNECFINCIALEKVTLDNNIKHICKDAFLNCNSLKVIYFLGNEEEFDSIIIDEGNDSFLHADIIFTQEVI